MPGFNGSTGTPKKYVDGSVDFQIFTPTAGSNVNLYYSSCYFSGKLACVNLAFNMSADADATQILLSGLPSAKRYTPVLAGCSDHSSGGSKCQINTTGTITNNNDTFASGKMYYINCCYPIA